MHPKDLSIQDFTYELPEERIAKYPLKERDMSKLLVWERNTIHEDIYLNLDGWIPQNTLMIYNNTKVVEARLLFEKSTGTRIEIFCLEPDDQYPEITTAMLQQETVIWKCLVGGAKKWKEEILEQTFTQQGKTVKLKAEKIEKKHDYFIIRFSWDKPEMSFAELLHIAGVIPLPPYLNRKAEDSDKTDYQTIYARYDGSVAAPTAGLHFSNRLFEKLRQKNIENLYVTLHVGAGTFKPVKAPTMETHEMHWEYIDVTKTAIERIATQTQSGCIVVVGTTSLRTVETLYWMGVKIKMLKQPLAEIKTEQITISQWDPYSLQDKEISATEALKTLQAWMEARGTERLITRTQIIIAPPYKLKIAKGLVTNFHQPQSTLLLLISAIVKENWKKIYQYALDHQFRFLSYGDGCLLWNE